MKVCMLIKNSITHDARVLRSARALGEAGHEVVILGVRQNRSDAETEDLGFARGVRLDLSLRRALGLSSWQEGKPRLQRKTASAKLEKSTLPVRVRRQLRIDKGLLTDIWYLIKGIVTSVRLQADAYHVHDFRPIFIGLVAAKLRRAKLIYDAHELHLERNRSTPLSTWQKAFLKALESFAVKRCAAVVTVNDYIADYYRKISPRGRVITVMNCVDYRPAPGNKGRLRKRLGLDSRARIVLYQGYMTVNRFLHELVESVEFMPKHYVLVFMGDGPLEAGLREHVRYLGLAGRVHFLGFVPHRELLNYTVGADVGTCVFDVRFPSYQYALGNKFFEYLHAGLPMLFTRNRVYDEIFSRYRIGELMDGARPREIAKRLKTIVENKHDYDEGIPRAQLEFRWEPQARRLVDLYASLEANAKRNV